MTNAGERQVPLPETDSRAKSSVCFYRRRARLVLRAVKRVFKNVLTIVV